MKHPEEKPSYLAKTKEGVRVMVRHKNYCGHWQGKACDCDPAVINEPNGDHEQGH